MQRRLIITGNLGRDAELKTTASNKQVLTFSIANTVGFGDNKKTTWFRCNLWGARAEKLASHLTKGTKLMISGELQVREYEGKDGSKKTSVEVFVKDLEFIGGKASGDSADNGSVPAHMADDFEADNVPF